MRRGEGCGQVWVEVWDDPGMRGSVGKRVVSRSGTPIPRPQLP